MKRILALAFALIMIVCLASCGEKPEPTQVTEATVATAATTEATAEPTTAEPTTTEEPIVVVPMPALYADFEFVAGAEAPVADKAGNVSIVSNTAIVEETVVSHNGKTTRVDALKTSTNEYVVCKFDNMATAEDVKNMMQANISIEAFYLCGNGTYIMGIVCGTQDGGWGLAQRQTNVPYFITGEGAAKKYVSVDATGPASREELIHVVCNYDYQNMKMEIWINGEKSAEKALGGEFFPGVNDTYNMFCLGSDIKVGGYGGDFPTTGGLTLVNARIYSDALTQEQITYAYEQSLKIFD